MRRPHFNCSGIIFEDYGEIRKLDEVGESL